MEILRLVQKNYYLQFWSYQTSETMSYDSIVKLHCAVAATFVNEPARELHLRGFQSSKENLIFKFGSICFSMGPYLSFMDDPTPNIPSNPRALGDK